MTCTEVSTTAVVVFAISNSNKIDVFNEGAVYIEVTLVILVPCAFLNVFVPIYFFSFSCYSVVSYRTTTTPLPPAPAPPGDLSPPPAPPPVLALAAAA